MPNRRFPPPWTVKRIRGGFKVLDANRQSLAYVYSRETKGAAGIAGVLTEDEARFPPPWSVDQTEASLGPGAAIWFRAVIHNGEQLGQAAEIFCVRLQIIVRFLIGLDFLDVDGK